jgi:hypothetical protein
VTDARPQLRCPVCRAGFRDSVRCSRCGADLSPLMRLAARAYLARQAGREALRRGNLAASVRLARQAQGLHATDQGRRLREVAVRLSELLSGRSVTASRSAGTQMSPLQ